MKKKIFLYLLKKYTKTETDRVEILKQIEVSISEEYYNQTHMGNMYNLFIEVLISNSTFKNICRYEGDDGLLDMLKVGIANSVDKSSEIVKDKLQNERITHGF